MTIAPVLMHTPPDDEPEYELQFPTVRDRANRVSIAVSATVNGVLIAVEPIGAVSVDIARELARQILEAAAWVDSGGESMTTATPTLSSERIVHDAPRLV